MFVAGPHNGGACYTDAGHKERTDLWGYAGAYRAGDLVFMSGIVLMAAEDERVDAEELKAKSRALFERAGDILASAGASLRDVVDIVSFHAWDSAWLADGLRGDRAVQFDAFAAAKRAFMAEPHPAWTAVGTSGLIVGDKGLVEMRMVAYVPKGAA